MGLGVVDFERTTETKICSEKDGLWLHLPPIFMVKIEQNVATLRENPAKS